MTRRSRTRQLSPEEKRLWSHVARHVKPMQGKALPPEPEPEAKPPAPSVPAAATLPPPLPALAPSKPALPPMAPVERKTLQAEAERIKTEFGATPV